THLLQRNTAAITCSNERCRNNQGAAYAKHELRTAGGCARARARASPGKRPARSGALPATGRAHRRAHSRPGRGGLVGNAWPRAGTARARGIEIDELRKSRRKSEGGRRKEVH